MFVYKHFLCDTRSGRVRLLIFREVVAICNFFRLLLLLFFFFTLHLLLHLRAFWLYCCAIWFLKALVLFSLSLNWFYFWCFICSCFFFLYFSFPFFFIFIFTDCLLCNRKLWWREDRDVKEYKKALWKWMNWIPCFYLFHIILLLFFELLKLACIFRRMISGKNLFPFVRHRRNVYWNLGFSDVCIYYYYYNSFVIKSYLLNERKGFSESLQKGFEFLKLVIFYCC